MPPPRLVINKRKGTRKVRNDEAEEEAMESEEKRYSEVRSKLGSKSRFVSTDHHAIDRYETFSVGWRNG